MSADNSEPFRRDSLFALLAAEGMESWIEPLRRQCDDALRPERHGDLADWLDVWRQLPITSGRMVAAPDDGAVVIEGTLTDAQRRHLSMLLMTFRPWRKGPFRLFGIDIDTEWRSDLKWQRLRDHVDFRRRLILDVGCGNGYYGWKMLEAGAQAVVGIDPTLLYVMQHEVIRRCGNSDALNFVLPISDDQLPDRLRGFDVAVSMGVLYHRTSPIDHLQKLAGCLKQNGRLVLETLIIESSGSEMVAVADSTSSGNRPGTSNCDGTAEELSVLVPEDRYAMMRNVWFIPSLPLLHRWLKRTGFCNITTVDVTATTSTEQRKTDWMTFDSLSDFLNPNDPTRTIEGYPAPVRAIVTAERC